MTAQSSYPTDKGPVGLRVKVFSELDGRTTDLLFDRFPIRVGRNPMNDLVLRHEYVSQWHAVISFFEGTIILTQVGSSNSVRVDNRKLLPNEEVVLEGGELIRVQPFSLRVEVESIEQPFQQPAAPAPFALSPLGAPGVLALETAIPNSQRASALGPMPGTGSLLFPQESVRPPSAAPVPAAAAASPLEQTALRSLNHLAQRFVQQPLPNPETAAFFAERTGEILDIFLRCFIALQKGQRQFRQAMDIKALDQHNHPVEKAKTVTDLAAALFISSGGGTEGTVALENAFKNIMIHQVALIDGLMAGVRTLLKKLSPKTVSKEAASGSSRSSPSAKVLWETYERMHADLAEEDTETFDTIFGAQFGKAYSALLGKKSKSKSKD
jgi:type VI secretion system protein ImpI